MTVIAKSLPYAWPWSGRIQPRQTAVLVFSGDTNEAPPAQPLARLQALIADIRPAGVRVVFLPRKSSPQEAAIEFDLQVVQPTLGAFAGSDIDLVLRNAGITDLIIAGFPLELGADCTLREANDRGYECLIVEDCCSGLTAVTFAGAVSSMQMSGGIFGAVAQADQVRAAFAHVEHAAEGENEHGVSG